MPHVKPKYNGRAPGGLSKDSEKRQRQLANLEKRPGKGSARYGRARTKNIPGMTELIEASNDRQAVIAFCRQNTPAAFRSIYEIMVGPFSPRVRLFAAEMLLNRGWGQAPQLVQLKTDATLAQPSGAVDGKSYAAEVYRILKEAGAVVPGDDDVADIKRDDAIETVVEVNAEPVVEVNDVPIVELKQLPPPPRAFRRRVDGKPVRSQPAEPPDPDAPIAWLLDAFSRGRLEGSDISPETYRHRIRPLLMASADLRAQDIVSSLDRRYAPATVAHDTDPLAFLFNAHREQRLDSVALDREQYRVRVRSMLQRRPTNPAAREIIIALDQRFA